MPGYLSAMDTMPVPSARYIFKVPLIQNGTERLKNITYLPNQKIIVAIFTLTAPWCSLKLWTGLCILTVLSCTPGQTNTMLSLPPLAKNLPSGDHFRPQTSWLWPLRVPIWCSATRTSWWWMWPDLAPLQEKKHLVYSMHVVLCHGVHASNSQLKFNQSKMFYMWACFSKLGHMKSYAAR